MEIKAIDHNVNILAMQKNGKKYGMCCAWCTQAGADKLICCVGPQSATGQAMEKGDIVGFSNLNKDQKMIAFQLGDLQRHSSDTDKLAGVDHIVDEGAILIGDARAQVKCQVIDILHLPGIEAENVLYLQMLSGKENGGDALHIADLPM
ncbi:MAG: flavin reductase [Synergistaceae bacterium]|nr:flavin reductase [Synergistaceae bacterium]